MTELLPQMNNENLIEWQRQEIENSKIENVMNQIIETCKSYSSYFNNNNNTYHLEESAILMAIRAHGLHRNYNVATGPILSTFINGNQQIRDTRNIIEDGVAAAIEINGLKALNNDNGRNF